MAQEDYELDVLLDLRAEAKEQAEQAHMEQTQELMRRQQQAAQARQTLTEAQTKRAQACADFDQKLSQAGLDIGRIQAFDDYVRGLKQHEDELAEKITQADRAVDAQRVAIRRAHEALVQAIKDLEAVETHHAQWQQEQDLITQRKQSDAMDEIASRLWREQNS